MFQLLLVKNDGTQTLDITPIVGVISWDYNLSLLSVMEFDLIWNDTSFFPTNPCDLGDIVLLVKDNTEVTRGVIVSESRTGRETIKYTVYDYAWYLGKSKSVYQFNGIPASGAIMRILNDFGMLIGSIPEMNTPIDKIYLEKSPAEIIEDIYKLEERSTGKRYNVEMREGKIYFEEMKDLVITATFRFAENIESIDVRDNPLSAERKRSIESMRNRVKILIERDKNDEGLAKYEVVATAQDDELISKFGLVEDLYKIDAQDAAKAREVSRILLKRLARIQETSTLKLIGDVDVKAGRLMDLAEPVTGIAQRFMIITAKHSVSNQFHTMSLELALPEDVK